jgi:hypothetical protein
MDSRLFVSVGRPFLPETRRKKSAVGDTELAVSINLTRLLGPGEPEIGCDECFDQLDRYVELGLAGSDPEAALPGFSAHLVGCPACREDYESLKTLIADEEAKAR